MRRSCRRAVLILFALTAASCRQQTQIAKPSPAALEQAKKLVEEGRAIESNAIHLDGRSPPIDKKAYERSIPKYTEAIRICPDYSDAYIWRCVAYDSLGDRNKAVNDARAALALHPNEARTYLLIAFPFEGEEKRKVLRAGMERSSPKKITYYTLWSALALTHRMEEDYEAFVAEQRRMISGRQQSQNPSISSSSLTTEYYLLGTAYGALDRHNEAEKAFRNALKHAIEGDRNFEVEFSRLPKTKQAELGKWMDRKHPFSSNLCEYIIRSRMRKGDYYGARAAIAEFRSKLIVDATDGIYDAVLDVLEAKKSRGQHTDLISKARRLTQGDFYHRFTAAVLQTRYGKKSEAAKDLAAFTKQCGSKPGELKWEVAKAHELIGAIRENGP